jgi:hypothetical protein
MQSDASLLEICCSEYLTVQHTIGAVLLCIIVFQASGIYVWCLPAKGGGGEFCMHHYSS